MLGKFLRLGIGRERTDWVSWRRTMIGAASIVSVLLGTAAAIMAEHFPAYTEAIETCAGVLLIAGFALAGSCLPVVL